MSLVYRRNIARRIALDDEAGLFSGTVAGLRDVVHFAGRTAAELSQAFRDRVDDYLAWCAEHGKLPDKPYNGRFPVRVTPEQHRKAALRTAEAGISLNAWIAQRIEAA